MSRRSKTKFGLGLLPGDVHDRTWRKLEVSNAKDAWRWWMTRAPDDWISRYYSAKPWANPRLSAAEAYRLRYGQDPEFRLTELFRTYARKAAKGRFGEYLRSALVRGGGSEVCELFGYSIPELRRHLEKQFGRQMSWELFAEGAIHIDHIIPLASFDLSDEQEVRAAWSLTNLRPLWARENVTKGARRTLLV